MCLPHHRDLPPYRPNCAITSLETMRYALQGQLSKRSFPDLLCDITAKRLSGLLRLSNGPAIKAIFIEDGRPVFAISNLPNEQFEHRLTRDRLATRGLIEAGKKRNENTQRLGRTLVEIGVLNERAMQDSARALATEIIESLFEWRDGEYGFEEGATASHDTSLGWAAAESILERARSAAEPPGPSGPSPVISPILPNADPPRKAREVKSRDSGPLKRARK